jgi:hypothetical protein
MGLSDEGPGPRYSPLNQPLDDDEPADGGDTIVPLRPGNDVTLSWHDAVQPARVLLVANRLSGTAHDGNTDAESDPVAPLGQLPARAMRCLPGEVIAAAMDEEDS